MEKFSSDTITSISLNENSENKTSQIMEDAEKVKMKNLAKKANISRLSLDGLDINCEFNSKDSITLSWSDVNVWTVQPGISKNCFKKHKRFKKIVTDLNGTARPGRMLALLAPSGSGKTTFLNYLADFRASNLKYSGTTLINGVKGDIKPYSAYLQQTDLFFRHVTVREHLMFHAELRIGSKMSKIEKINRVDELLRDFNLIKQQNLVLDDVEFARKNLSGGEKRRLSIITEILTKPRVLFADETTSGLDSHLAENVIFYLKKYALAGNTIICTIHQPSTDTFSFFDDLMVLSEGRSIYFGTNSNALEYFKKLGYPCPTNYNPADHYITVVSIIKKEIDEKKNMLLDKMSNSSKVNFADESTSESFSLENVKPKNGFKEFWGTYASNSFVQFKHLFLRTIITSARHPMTIVTRVLQEIVLGLIIGLLYLQMAYTTDNLVNYAGIFFFVTAGITVNATLNVILNFGTEYKIYKREHHSRLYRSSLYFLAKTFGEMPMQIMLNSIFSILVYFMIGLRPGAKYFFIFWFLSILVHQAALSYGYLISALADDVLVAAAMSTPMLIPIMVFGGFLLANSDIPIYLRWIKYVSWFNYGFESYIVNQFVGTIINCTPKTCILINIIPSIPGDLVVLILELNKNNLYPNMGGLILLIIGYRFVSNLIMILKTYLHSKISPI